VVVPPQSRFLVSTMERVRMPSDVTAQLWIRSSFARRGVLGAFGKIEAGFEGTLTVGGFNAARAPLDLPIGERFCQVVFERMESLPPKLYADRPAGCRTYPFVLTPQGHVVRDEDCPWRREFAQPPGVQRRLIQITGTVAREAARR